MLPVREVRRRATLRDGFERLVRVQVEVGVVVRELVVVPGHHPRVCLVSGLERLVRLVLGVPRAVVRQRRQRGGRRVRAGASGQAGTLVDVVAEMDDELDVVLPDQIVERRVVAVGVVLARDEGELQVLGHGSVARRRAEPPDRALVLLGLEAVPVLALRFQASDLGVDRVDLLRPDARVAAVDDVQEARVLRDLEADAVAGVAEPAAVERVGREARPEHDAVRRRLTRGDAELEGVVGERRPGARARYRAAVEDDGRGAARAQQGPPADACVPVAVHCRSVPPPHRRDITQQCEPDPPWWTNVAFCGVRRALP